MYTRKLCLFLSILLLTGLSFFNASAQKPSATDPKTNKYKGLQISRTDLINSLSVADSLLHFKQVPNTKGTPKFAAKGSFGARIEITGTEDNLTLAQWMVSQPANGTLSRLAFTQMAFFIDLLAKQEGAMWFFQQAFLYTKTPTSPISSSTIIDANKLMFTYYPAKKTFTITVSPQ
ncbi:MAG: hypothetical protein ABIN91_21600 [Mucilaginibacter sp.]|uniref:hypothetical protein n=1 Tax=Mucilaginibacter sp. TaxID=1882438 RepID=UPI0032674E1D